jgi:carbon storage regulator CsrA|tara:strand:- start:1219 stop:1437 length:219 start_codon:yes stop_codon:yes gene_type:complete
MAILEDHSAKRIFAMLTLSRREFESLTFFTSDGEIQINIEDIKGGQVRLSMDMPDCVKVWRNELLKDNSDQA